MDNSNETDVHSMATKALAEALPKIQSIINGELDGSIDHKLRAGTLLKEIYEAISVRQTSAVDELIKLSELSGKHLSDDEYNKQKMKLLERS